MSKRTANKMFNELEVKQLEANPNVVRVTKKHIVYSVDFKNAALRAYNAGQSPAEIFVQAGFELDVIGSKNPRRCIRRWLDCYRLYGEDGLNADRRGKGSPGRPTTKTLSAEEKLKRAEAKIRLLEMENEFLKKLEALERQKRLF